MNTYRAAGWVASDHQSDVRLTNEEHKDLPDAELLDIALATASEIGLDMRYGEISIGVWSA